MTHLCPDCGGPNKRRNRRCAECYRKHKQRNRKRTPGMCNTCGAPTYTTHNTRCRPCYQATRRTTRQPKARGNVPGTCTQCGNKTSTTSITQCRPCYQAKLTAHRLANPHTCIDCGGPTSKQKYKHCQACRSKHYEQRHCEDCGKHLGSPATCCRPCSIARRQDIDEMAVERLKTGSPVQSNKAERQQAAAQLLARGLTNQAVAQRLHVSTKTIERYKAAA